MTAIPHPAPEPARAHVRFRDIAMAFGSRVVHASLSCAFPAGKITVILGGSGSGKSTVLRLIGGLVRPQRGALEVDGDDITRLSERQLYAVRRKLGMMFQGGALLDSLTVFDNVAFPLRERRTFSRDEIAARVRGALEAVGLRDVAALLPGQLSGGMMRRVALARALMMEPVVLLCDEPLSGLDPISTRRIEALLLEINRRQGMTIIVVSHHVPSTLRMADHILLLLPDGVVEGTPRELLENKDKRVMAFLTEEVDETLIGGAEVEPLPAGHQGRSW